MNVETRAEAIPAAVRGWPLALGLLAVAVAGATLLLLPSAQSMVRIWIGSATFNYGFLIAPVSLYLIWEDRAYLARFTPRPSLWGLAGVALAAAAWLVGVMVDVDVVQHFALVAVIQGSVVALLGTRLARAIWFPLFYLSFSVPFGEFLVPPLQDLTAQFIVNGLHVVGIPVFLDGVFLSIPNGRFEVAEACAGVRFLVAMVALGVLFGFTFLQTWWRRVLFIAFICAAPIVANGVRAFGIVTLGYVSDMTIGVGPEHIVYGWILFAIVMAGCLGIGWLAREAPPARTPPPAEPRPSPWSPIAMAAAIVAVVALAPAYAAVTALPSARPQGVAVVPWTVGGGFASSSRLPDWTPPSEGADATALLAFDGPAGSLDTFVAYYAWQTDTAQVLHFKNKPYDGVTWFRSGSGRATTTLGGVRVVVDATRIVSALGNRLVWRWYLVDGAATGDRITAKLLELRGRLLGHGGPAALIMLSAPYDEQPAEAEEVLRAFTAALPPLQPWLHAIPVPEP